MTGRRATDMWYDEIKDFDFSNKVFGAKTGHFTQLVWKDCSKIGAAISKVCHNFLHPLVVNIHTYIYKHQKFHLVMLRYS